MSDGLLDVLERRLTRKDEEGDQYRASDVGDNPVISTHSLVQHIIYHIVQGMLIA